MPKHGAQFRSGRHASCLFLPRSTNAYIARLFGTPEDLVGSDGHVYRGRTSPAASTAAPRTPNYDPLAYYLRSAGRAGGPIAEYRRLCRTEGERQIF